MSAYFSRLALDRRRELARHHQLRRLRGGSQALAILQQRLHLRLQPPLLLLAVVPPPTLDVRGDGGFALGQGFLRCSALRSFSRGLDHLPHLHRALVHVRLPVPQLPQRLVHDGEVRLEARAQLQELRRRRARLPRAPSLVCFLYSIHCCVNSAPMTEIGSAMSKTLASIARHATNRPRARDGHLVAVPHRHQRLLVHQNESGMDLYGLEMRVHPGTNVPSSSGNWFPASAPSSHSMSSLRL